MELDVKSFVKNVTTRAKIAFVLGISEHLLDKLVDDLEGIEKARRSLDIAWEWQEYLQLSGDQIFELLIDEDDDGLILHESMAEEGTNMLSAWLTLTTSIIYVSWCAYQHQNNTDMPSPVCEVDDNAVELVVQHAQQVETCNVRAIEQIGNFLVAEHSANSLQEIGSPISREFVSSFF